MSQDQDVAGYDEVSEVSSLHTFSNLVDEEEDSTASESDFGLRPGQETIECFVDAIWERVKFARGVDWQHSSGEGYRILSSCNWAMYDDRPGPSKEDWDSIWKPRLKKGLYTRWLMDSNEIKGAYIGKFPPVGA